MIHNASFPIYEFFKFQFKLGDSEEYCSTLVQSSEVGDVILPSFHPKRRLILLVAVSVPPSSEKSIWPDPQKPIPCSTQSGYSGCVCWWLNHWMYLLRSTLSWFVWLRKSVALGIVPDFAPYRNIWLLASKIVGEDHSFYGHPKASGYTSTKNGEETDFHLWVS